MKALVRDHFELSLNIAKMNREKTAMAHKIMDELFEVREHRYFNINWTLLYREQIQRSIRELHD